MVTELIEKETHKLFGISSGGVKAADEKVKWAMFLLENGIEVEDISSLAMLTKPYNEFEADQYFQNVLKELKIKKPGDEEALWNYAFITAKEVIDRELAPEKGIEFLYGVNIELDYPNQLGRFSDLEDEWYCINVIGMTKHERNKAIVAACKDLIEIIDEPELHKA